MVSLPRLTRRLRGVGSSSSGIWDPMYVARGLRNAWSTVAVGSRWVRGSVQLVIDRAVTQAPSRVAHVEE